MAVAPSEGNGAARIPPTVTTYRECYDGMVSSGAFAVDDSSGVVQEDYDNFGGEDVWEHLALLEAEYDCAGFCYKPLFYLTRSIADGPPPQACTNPVFEDVFKSAKSVCTGMGVALLISFLCQLGLCGGMPANAGDSKEKYEEKADGSAA